MDDRPDAKWFKKESKTSTKDITKVLAYPTTKYCFEYNMRHQNRGKAHIFNHTVFSPKLKLSDRSGSDIDRDDCYNVLKKIGFIVEEHNNLTFAEITKVLRAESEADHSSEDCIAFFILSHGNHNSEVFAQDRAYKLEIMFDYLTPEKCKTLTGKPKLFFVQACRGVVKDRGVNVQSNVEFDSFESYSDNSRHFTVPLYADMLIAYATLPGFVAWRNTTKGSPFIGSLCAILNEFWQKYDILTMMTLVIQQVAIGYETNLDQFKLSPCFLSNLTRMLKFSKESFQE